MEASQARPGAAHARRTRWLLLLSVVVGAVGAWAPQARSQSGTPDAGPVPSYQTTVHAQPEPDRAPREDRAASASVVTRDRTPRAGESLPQILSELPGASVTALGGLGAMATLSLRGSAPNQVLVYIDGVPQNTPTGGGVDLGAIPLPEIDRIEVYRGTSPIGFGASGIGGVVSLTTRAPQETGAEVETGGGSFGTGQGRAHGSWRSGRLGLAGGVSILSSQGDFPYVMDRGTAFDPSDDQRTVRVNNALRQVDGNWRGVVELSGRRRLDGSILFFQRDQGLPGGGNAPTHDSSLGLMRSQGALTYQSRDDLGPGGQLQATAYGSVLRSAFNDPNHEVTAMARRTRDWTSTTGATLRLSQPVLSLVRMSAVLDGRFDRFVPHDLMGGTLDGAPAQRLWGAAGAEAHSRIAAAGLDLIGALRLESARETTSGRDLFMSLLPTSAPIVRTLPIARASLIQELSSAVQLKANAGRYARLPSTTELYGDTGYLLGNSTLRPESGLNADLGVTAGWSGPWGTLCAQGAVFGSQVRDLIQLVQNAQGQARPANIGRARVLGAEGSAEVSAGRHLRLVGQATFTDARDTSEVAAGQAHQLPLRPRSRVYARPELRAIQLPAGTQLGLHADLDVTDGNFLDRPNVVLVPRRVLLGAGASLDFPGGLRLLLTCQNLTDQRINDVADYPLPGRAFYASLLWATGAKTQGE